MLPVKPSCGMSPELSQAVAASVVTTIGLVLKLQPRQTLAQAAEQLRSCVIAKLIDIRGRDAKFVGDLFHRYPTLECGSNFFF